MTATGPAVMEVFCRDARAAIERDLSCYADQWRYLQQVEVEAPYGPVDPEPAGRWATARARIIITATATATTTATTPATATAIETTTADTDSA